MRLIPLLLIILALVGCGKGTTASDPKVQARSLMEAFRDTNWTKLHALTAFPGGAGGTNAAEFAAGFEKGFKATGGDIARKLFNSMTDITTGEATITGNRASLPVGCTLDVQGEKKVFSGVANMIQEGGVWKWDLTNSGSFEQAIGTQLKLLLGAPK